MAKKLTQEEFIEKAKEIHGNKYDYSKVEYVNSQTKICIICPKHGEFWQKPNSHLLGKGCKKCGIEKKLEKVNYKAIIEKINKIHGNKYDLSLFTEYVNTKAPITIICKKHGKFETTINRFVSGKHGCKKCANENDCNRKKLNKTEIFEKFKNIHNNKYKYCDDFDYKNEETKIKIFCPKHGYFYQSVHCHLKGRGCPKCKQSKLENEIEIELNNNNIKFDYRQHPKWLEGLELDFYLPGYNIAIECQGQQHYEPVEQFGGKIEFKNTVERDTKKAQLCKENGIKLLYFTHYPNINEEGNIYKNKDKLLEEILHNVKSI